MKKSKIIDIQRQESSMESFHKLLDGVGISDYLKAKETFNDDFSASVLVDMTITIVLTSFASQGIIDTQTIMHIQKAMGSPSKHDKDIVDAINNTRMLMTMHLTKLLGKGYFNGNEL